MGSPRVDVVFCLWQCDKENHGWREGPPVTVLCQSFRSAGRAFTLRLNQFRTKTRILLYVVGRQPSQNIGRFKTTIPQGAATSVWAGFIAPADEVGGHYCENCHVGTIVPDDVVISTISEGVRGYALDPQNAEALWKKSEEMVGESF